MAVSGGFGSLFSASTSIQSVVTKSHSQGDLELSAYQIGGDPTRLANIFGSKNSGGVYPVLDCSLTALSQCQAMMANVIGYAQNDFSQQIKQATNGQMPQSKSLAVVGQPTTATYVSIGLKPAPSLPATVQPARL